MRSISGVKDLPADLQKLLAVYGEQNPGASKVERAVKNAMKLIAESNALHVETAPQGLPTVNVLVLNGGTGRNSVDDSAFYLSEIPVLEGVGAHVRKSMALNLEKLLLEKQLETNENVSKYTRNRIDTEKATLERRHKEMRNKIEKNLAAMEDAARNNLIMKVFGWVMVAAMVALAIFTAGTSLVAAGAAASAMTTATAVGTAGAAAGAAGAAAGTAAVTATVTISTTKVVMFCISAALALANQIMEETGTTEQMIKDLTARLRASGVKDASLKAQLIVGLGMMLAIAIPGFAGGGAITQALGFLKAVRALKLAVPLVMTAMGAASLTQQGFAIAANYKAGMAEADVSEIRALVQLVQQMVDETQEEMEEIIQKIQDLIGKMFEIIKSKMDAETEVANNIGRMLI